MRTPLNSLCVLTASVLICAHGSTAGASNVVHMTLRDLVVRADRIVRGTVLVATDETVAVGGGHLPIVRYGIRVDESFKGAAAEGDTIDVRLLAPPKQLTTGGFRRAALLRDLPKFAVGRDYLFVLTRPSRLGLSTTVGLGQGLFQLRGHPGQEEAVNEANNLGLFAGIQGGPHTPGPVPYAGLVKEIRTLLGR